MNILQTISSKKIAEQVLLDQRVGNFAVYLSPIDYDDQYYTLIDSISQFLEHDFHYGGSGIERVAKFPSFDLAEQCAADLHLAMMRRLSLENFQKRHQLEFLPRSVSELAHRSELAVNLSEFYYDWEFRLTDWCCEQQLNLDCLNVEDETDFYEENGDEDYEIQWAIIEELIEKQMYEKLDQLREALGIGKFSFIHPLPEQ